MLLIYCKLKIRIFKKREIAMFKTEQFYSCRVRQANGKDANQVIEMLTNAASWLKENGINQWSYLHSGKENHAIEAAISKGTTYVVEDKDGKLLASFNLSSEQNDWDLVLWGGSNEQAVYLHRLVVARNDHNKQIGKKLLTWMIENMTDGMLRLDCVGHNKVLNQLYQDAGFTFIGSHDMGGKLFSKYEQNIV